MVFFILCQGWTTEVFGILLCQKKIIGMGLEESVLGKFRIRGTLKVCGHFRGSSVFVFGKKLANTGRLLSE